MDNNQSGVVINLSWSSSVVKAEEAESLCFKLIHRKFQFDGQATTSVLFLL